MNTTETLAAINSLCRQRKASLQCRNAIEQSCVAYARLMLGWLPTMDLKERTRINGEARAMVRSIFDGDAIEMTDAATLVLAKCQPWLSGFEAQQAEVKKLDKQLETLAKGLPIAPWVEGVRGLGYKSVALILGTTGDLSNYSNPAKVWKRMRMSVIDGKREIGGPRRAIMWVIGDVLIKSNKGKYREIYDRRKVYETTRAPEMSKMHAHRRAQRVMEKELLVDLWRQWRDAGSLKQAA